MSANVEVNLATAAVRLAQATAGKTAAEAIADSKAKEAMVCLMREARLFAADCLREAVDEMGRVDDLPDGSGVMVEALRFAAFVLKR